MIKYAQYILFSKVMILKYYFYLTLCEFICMCVSMYLVDRENVFFFFYGNNKDVPIPAWWISYTQPERYM